MFSALRSTWAGLALAVSAAIAYALSNAAVSLAYQGGSNPLTLAALRYVLPTAALITWLTLRGMPLLLPGRTGWLAAMLGVITAIYTWALLSSIAAIPLVLAIVIFYLFPLITTLIVGTLGWAKLRWTTFAAMFLAFGGLTLALDPRGADFSMVGVALASIAALGLGTVIAISSQVLHGSETPVVTLYMAAVACIALGTLCIVQGEIVLPRTSLGWIGFISSAAFFAYAMIAFFTAIALIGPMRTSLLSYAEPIFSAAFAVTLLGEVLTLGQVVGLAIVVATLIGSTLWRPKDERR
jgi:drug/metabolite transporter (DMT)-like permease